MAKYLVCLVFAALQLMASPAMAGRSDGVLRIAAEQVPESFDAYFNNVHLGSIIAHHVWDHLIERDPDTGQHKPSLATAWRWIDDKTLEFDLRSGVRFHNGEPFDADDVVHTLNFVADPANRVVTQQNVSWIARAEKLSALQVRLHLKTPFPAALEYLAGPVVIYPNEYYAAVGPQGMSSRPVGTGPYKVVEAQPGRLVRLERNADYFRESPRPAPTIEKIELRLIPDPDTQIAELMAGGLDWIFNVQPDQASRLRTRSRLTVMAGDTMRVSFLLLNRLEQSPTPALRDVRVRRAIAHAIDRQTLLTNLVGPGGQLIHAICYPTQFGCTDQVPKYAYDPVRAKALLTEAGFPDGFQTEFYAYRDRVQVEALIGILRAVGIRADLRYLQAPALRDALRAKKTPITQTTWGSFAINDSSAIVSAFFKFSEDDVTLDPEVRDLLIKADTTVDPVQRADAYARAYTIILDQAYAVPLFTLPTSYAFSSDLEFKPYPDQLPRFWLARWK